MYSTSSTPFTCNRTDPAVEAIEEVKSGPGGRLLAESQEPRASPVFKVASSKRGKGVSSWEGRGYPIRFNRESFHPALSTGVLRMGEIVEVRLLTAFQCDTSCLSLLLHSNPRAVALRLGARAAAAGAGYVPCRQDGGSEVCEPRFIMSVNMTRFFEKGSSASAIGPTHQARAPTPEPQPMNAQTCPPQMTRWALKIARSTNPANQKMQVTMSRTRTTHLLKKRLFCARFWCVIWRGGLKNR